MITLIRLFLKLLVITIVIIIFLTISCTVLLVNNARDINVKHTIGVEADSNQLLFETPNKTKRNINILNRHKVKHSNTNDTLTNDTLTYTK